MDDAKQGREHKRVPLTSKGRRVQMAAWCIDDHEWSQFRRGEQEAQRSEQPQEKKEDSEKK
ncbi:MAG: hypothetical protein Q8P56_04650 [Candidatus Uhrbacteria bacterium]|nr:hypothetical protein [Candidatus Uhrbacteria bacterium]